MVIAARDDYAPEYELQTIFQRYRVFGRQSSSLLCRGLLPLSNRMRTGGGRDKYAAGEIVRIPV